MSLYWMLTIVIALTGAVMLALATLADSRYGTTHKLREAKRHNLTPSRFWSVAVPNSIFSIVLVYVLTYLAGARVFEAGGFHIARCLVEGVAILLLYDFFYYLVHRYPFHEWKLLRRVHAMHHVVRNPTALDSLYLHPLENFLGLGLLWGCAFLVSRVGGPVSAYSFAWVFLVYSVLNVVVHAGIDGLGIVSYVARRHTKHHKDMNGKNYASVTPIWDIVFRTEEP